MSTDLFRQWHDEDKLMLLECWARDGYIQSDIASRIGITLPTLHLWMKKSPEIKKALSKGAEFIDYQVENAVLKAALGYRTKEVKITTIMRQGAVVETIKEVTDKEEKPNISAAQTWLYNRKPNKWKNMNSRANIIEDLEENEGIEITISRAKQNELENDTDTEINQSVNFRKKTKEEIADEKHKKENKS